MSGLRFHRILKHWLLQLFSPGKLLRHKYETFKELLRHDKQCLELLTELEEIQYQKLPVDWARIEGLVQALGRSTRALIGSLVAMQPAAYLELERQFDRLTSSLNTVTFLPPEDFQPPLTLSLAEGSREPLLVGGKAHSLGRVLTETDLPVPRGFVVTTRAFHLFLKHNDLRPRLNKLLAEINLNDWETLQILTGEMAALVRNGIVPPEVVEEISQRLEEHRPLGLDGPWVVRSSALSEDGEASFAGQYASVLHVDTDGVLEAYKEVLASKYSARAVTYRLRCGLADQETPMAVILLEMIDSVVSGVIYSRTLERQGQESLALYAICGFGQHLVDGSAEPEIYYLSRESRPQLLESGGNSCLSPETAILLATWGLRLENLFGGPQDIEWCQNERGICYLVQSRPLRTESGAQEKISGDHAAYLEAYPLLLETGVTASPGVGAGPVFISTTDTDLGAVPEGAVLVTATLSPSIASVITRLRAVVTDAGSQASHFASIAREYGLPAIAGCKDATKRLPPGQNVIVDADHCRVYRGGSGFIIKESPRGFFPPDSPFATRLHNVMKLVSPLHLVDPVSPDFVPGKCRSIHDIVRFAHEKGMAEMFSLVGRSGRGLARARQLATDLPFTLYLLDLENCISPAAGPKKAVPPDLIDSPPMQACWRGLTHPEVVWHKGLVYMDWETLDRVSAGIISLKSAALASYAVIAREYLHLVLRFGYHFAVLDTLCGDNPEANYIAFRFKGGGGGYENRMRRIDLIRRILEWAGFKVMAQGDLLEARFERHSADTILSRLTLVGILQGKTQLLDMGLNTENHVEALVASFQARFGSYLSLEASDN